MTELLNYSGLPLMPIFARRNDGDLARSSASRWFFKFDDEGFDEPSESNGSGKPG